MIVLPSVRFFLSDYIMEYVIPIAAEVNVLACQEDGPDYAESNKKILIAMHEEAKSIEPHLLALLKEKVPFKTRKENIWTYGKPVPEIEKPKETGQSSAVCELYGFSLKDIPNSTQLETIKEIHRMQCERKDRNLREMKLNEENKMNDYKRATKLVMIENDRKLKENEQNRRLDMEENEKKRRLDMEENERKRKLDMEENERKRRLDMEENERKRKLDMEEKERNHKFNMDILKQKRERRAVPSILDLVWSRQPQGHAVVSSKEEVEKSIWDIVNKNGSRQAVWPGINVNDHQNKTLQFGPGCSFHLREFYIKKLVSKIWPSSSV